MTAMFSSAARQKERRLRASVRLMFSVVILDSLERRVVLRSGESIMPRSWFTVNRETRIRRK